MIVGFTIENWKSFKGSTTISWVARDINVHEERIQSLGHFGIKLLPISAIYGGNASGKTNLIDALKFARSMIVDGSENLGVVPVIPFLLGDEDRDKPTKLKFELVIDKIFYKYQFTVTRKMVLEEELKKVHPNNTEELLYNRIEQNFEFGAEIDPFTQLISKQSIRPEKLTLHTTNTFNTKQFSPVFDWFKESLLILDTKTKFYGLTELIEENGMHLEALNEALYFFDTGISGIEIDKLPTELVKALFPGGNIPSELIDNHSAGISGIQNELLSFKMKNGELELYRLLSKHHVTKDKTVRFGLHLESEGSKRLLDLLPSFLKLTSDSKVKVLVIDEIDRSIHPDLIQILIRKYLETINESSSRQLIFTTHDMSLIDSLVLRRDEICVTERDIEGVSRLHSFGDFKDIQDNENILELYKSGVLGGKPHILYKNSTVNPFIEPNKED